MGLPNRRCPNCGDTHQDFRPLTDEERAYALTRVDRADVGTYRRCAREGCLRVQSYFNFRAGFSLPESFREAGGCARRPAPCPRAQSKIGPWVRVRLIS
jgi:hypothetical protein